MADNDLDEQFKSWYENVVKTSQLTIKEQAQITKAAADAGAEVLKKETREKHYRDRKTGSDPHLADSIYAEANNVDGDKDGTAIFGFDPKKAYIARFINDGTKRISYTSGKKTRHDSKGRAYARGGKTSINGDHFVDIARKDAKSTSWEAEKKAFQEIIKEKGFS
ncbi:HK97 gp10 family phage protein [Oenococcus oeni]|uniref:HK97 gp10 family phage protein n=1 Tax=Oenococcus oeni TaxID=1247 RepID=UPI00050DA75A|nr:HK97 gp10 family phage protein [Oenococcus oeni]KGH73687.1 hypothetical protein X280_01805 [Oenococcus oeni IOEB_0502]